MQFAVTVIDRALQFLPAFYTAVSLGGAENGCS